MKENYVRMGLVSRTSPIILDSLNDISLWKLGQKIQLYAADRIGLLAPVDHDHLKSYNALPTSDDQ